MRQRVVFGLGFVVGIVLTMLAIVALALIWGSENTGPRLMHAVSCAGVDKDVRAFVNDELPGIIRTVRENKSGSGDERLMLVIQASGLKREIGRCRLLDAKALDTKIPLAVYFKKHDELFSELEPFLQEWRFKLPSEMRDVGRRLDRFEELQRDLAGGSR